MFLAWHSLKEHFKDYVSYFVTLWFYSNVIQSIKQ